MESDLEQDPPRKQWRFSLWKKLLVAAAGLLLVFGLVLTFLGGDDASSGGVGPANTLTTQGGEEVAAPADGGLAEYSPFFVKGGFSLLVGFCIGYALRTFFKASAVLLGVLLLVLFGLSYTGFVQVDWGAMDGAFDDLVARLKDEAEGFRSFVTGSLPSAALGAAGLFAGFKRK